MNATVLLLALAAVVSAADQPTIRAAVQPVKVRKPAADFALQDASGQTVKLTDFRDKVILLDFWATWCGGCKQEIPWFSEFQRTYSGQGFAVVGISLDEDGGKVLKPFLADTKPPYRMLLGDDSTAKRSGIGNLPDTYLIDRHGKVAAASTAGLVDKDNVESNIKLILAEH